MRSTMMDFPLTVGHIFEHGHLARAWIAVSAIV
jgi:hypothetical protein